MKILKLDKVTRCMLQHLMSCVNANTEFHFFFLFCSKSYLFFDRLRIYGREKCVPCRGCMARGPSVGREQQDLINLMLIAPYLTLGQQAR